MRTDSRRDRRRRPRAAPTTSLLDAIIQSIQWVTGSFTQTV
ncbi:hypothetical protein [Rhodococcus koreensis]